MSEPRAMITMTLEDFQSAARDQGVARDDIAMVCPTCRCVQSARDLIAAGAGADFESVERYLGFSCVGRFSGAPSPRKKPDGKPCNWTLGGFLRLHELEVVTPDGTHHPHMRLATPAEAAAHALETA